MKDEPTPPDERFGVHRWRDGAPPDHADDHLAAEEPMEIRVNGRPVSVTMRTPGHDEELAAGFLLTEGIIVEPDDLERIDRPGGLPEASVGNVVDAILSPRVAVDFDRLTRHVFASSSCGLCGKATIESVRCLFRPAQTAATVDAGWLLTLPERMRSAQATFERTGGLHAAAVFEAGGDLVTLREDIGRHNAVDKVVGRAVLDRRLPLDAHALLVSGRASFEICQKGLAAGLGIVAAVSAPSGLAVRFAEESGQTLVGFLRDRRFNVYAHPHRVRYPAE